LDACAAAYGPAPVAVRGVERSRGAPAGHDSRHRVLSAQTGSSAAQARGPTSPLRCRNRTATSAILAQRFRREARIGRSLPASSAAFFCSQGSFGRASWLRGAATARSVSARRDALMPVHIDDEGALDFSFSFLLGGGGVRRSAQRVPPVVS
jgi:hypothetical protein